MIILCVSLVRILLLSLRVKCYHQQVGLEEDHQKGLPKRKRERKRERIREREREKVSVCVCVCVCVKDHTNGVLHSLKHLAPAI